MKTLKERWLFTGIIPLCVIFLLFAGCGASTVSEGGDSGTIALALYAPTTNADGTPLTDLAGYQVYYGTIAGGPYGNSRDVGNVTTYHLTGLTKGTTYYIVATAYDDSGNGSIYSEEVSGVAE